MKELISKVICCDNLKETSWISIVNINSEWTHQIT